MTPSTAMVLVAGCDGLCSAPADGQPPPAADLSVDLGPPAVDLGPPPVDLSAGEEDAGAVVLTPPDAGEYEIGLTPINPIDGSGMLCPDGGCLFVDLR